MENQTSPVTEEDSNPVETTPKLGKIILKTILLLGVVYFGFLLGSGTLMTKLDPYIESGWVTNSETETQEEEPQQEKVAYESPVDGKKYQYKTKLGNTFYIQGAPYELIFEQGTEKDGGPDEYNYDGRQIIVSTYPINPDAHILREDNSGPCLTFNTLISDYDIDRESNPVMGEGYINFLTEYVCGDGKNAIVTSVTFETDWDSDTASQTTKITNVEILDISEYLRLSNKLSDGFKSLAWLDTDNLIFSYQYSHPQEDGTRVSRKEIYLFNINTLQKELIFEKQL